MKIKYTTDQRGRDKKGVNLVFAKKKKKKKNQLNTICGFPFTLFVALPLLFLIFFSVINFNQFD